MLKSFMYRVAAVALALALSIQLWAAPSVETGKSLFQNNCATCHAKNMKSKLTGPPLAGVQAKWGDDAALSAWIRNSQVSISKGVPQAVAIWNEYKPTVMTNFPNLTDDEIASILLYIEDAAKGPKTPVGPGTGAVAPTEKSSGNMYLYGGALLVLGLLAYLLSRTISNLDQIANAKEGKVLGEKTFWDVLTSKSVMAFIIFGLIVLGGYTTVNNAIAMGRQQGYSPEQPIKFSHATHAGQQKIDCQYCHDGARRSKHASIPAANTCINCHAAVKVGSKYGTGEITKIYASVGFNPTTGKYIENYDKLSEKEAEAIYKTWIGEQYKEAKSLTSLDSDAQLFVDGQWSDIKKSLTNETKKDFRGPIEWTRVHNLPDHVYFNHSQHVTVGQVQCQSCHGKVEGMEVLTQHAPLSMGWCINCHRQTDVKFADNEYYKSYERFHKEIKEGKREKVTVEDIGGLECQKCHY